MISLDRAMELVLEEVRKQMHFKYQLYYEESETGYVKNWRIMRGGAIVGSEPVSMGRFYMKDNGRYHVTSNRKTGGGKRHFETKHINELINPKDNSAIINIELENVTRKDVKELDANLQSLNKETLRLLQERIHKITEY